MGEKELRARCLNCGNRFSVKSETEVAECPECGVEWKISWPEPDQPKVRGPA